MTEGYAEVKSAAEWIDANLDKIDFPAEWRTRINPDTLDVHDSRYCVFGQVTGKGMAWANANWGQGGVRKIPVEHEHVFAATRVNRAWQEYIKATA